ncbi:MAG: precorrin-3B C(17)-methyltransferase [Rhodobacterales bacterium]|nr:precorrin-3B C(17)-methyltransferase [Rhodobacterales bacterium]
MPDSPALVVLTPGGLATAQRLRPHLPGAEIHGRAGRVSGADVPFDETTAHLRALFTAGRPIIGVCAAGILIRALAPLLADKRAEPPVLALSEDGAQAVPLLGGHRGANALARAVADALGGNAAVTTAGDVALGLALDDPPPGWHLADPIPARAVTAALLAGESVGLTVEAGVADWLSGLSLSARAGMPGILVTDREPAPDEARLVFHPPVLALGVGCERGVPTGNLMDHVHTTLYKNGLSPRAIACVVSIDVKADEEAVHALADHLGVPARFLDAETLERETPRLENPSDLVFAEVGCHGVAEGAALAAAGPAGRLVAPKAKGDRVTCAVARCHAGIDAARVGRPRGHLTIAGIGPGRADWRTPAVTAALRDAQDVVGYGLYLDLLGDLMAGKGRWESDLSNEEARARRALDLAAEGRRVVLVGSGDAGIYALATLVFELLERDDRADWNRVAIAVEPGVSAFQAAAARAGAPVGHDFCTISLSDLLTPWPVIENRLKAAADGDFVVSLYNPVSQRRRHQIEAARDILLTARPPETPVILARNLGRDGETVTVIPLADLTPDRVDMLTLVMIGSRETRVAVRGTNTWIYTPRGYAAKRTGKDTP